MANRRNAFLEVKYTTNSSVYNKAKKMVMENKGIINCSRCPYHRHENDVYYRDRNWKIYRKTQYKAR